MPDINSNNFSRLLARLDPDPEKAGEKYIDLHLKLTREFARLGATGDLNTLADKTLEDIERKLEKEEIENINAFARKAAYFVHLRNTNKKEDAFDDEGEIVFVDPKSLIEKNNPMLDCINECLAKLPPKEREMLLKYYDYDLGDKPKDQRKSIVRLFNKTIGAIKTSVCRSRKKLEDCAINCAKRRGLRVTK